MNNLKNTLTIIMDTEAEQNIMIGKPEGTQPRTQEELAEMVILDMATLCEALVTTIRAAHTMGIKDEADSMRDCIKHLQEGFVDPDFSAIVAPEVQPAEGS